VFSSCDFVDRSVCPENKDDPRIHTNQHESKYFRLAIDSTFEAKPSSAEQGLLGGRELVSKNTPLCVLFVSASSAFPWPDWSHSTNDNERVGLASQVTSSMSRKYFSSCLVRVISWIVPFLRNNKDDPRIHTNQHETHYHRNHFEAKLTCCFKSVEWPSKRRGRGDAEDAETTARWWSVPSY